MMQRRLQFIILCVLFAVTACDSIETPSWLGGSDRVIKRTPGERMDVLLNHAKLTPDTASADIPIEVPDQANLARWGNRNEAMKTQHIGLTGIKTAQHARIGDGRRFSRANGPAPVIDEGLVIAMDAAGVLSAHDESNIDTILWTNRDGLNDDTTDVLGGGLTSDAGVVYATTGDGSVRALSLKDGKLLWKASIGAPVRGAPAAGAGIVAVITADNQTIALDATTGTTRWSHRGIHEAAGYVSTVAPVIVDDTVIAAYSSGEIFALRAESGSVIWNDALGGSIKTRASAVFNGIDADPVVNEGVVVAISSAGEMQASALLNGRPLWQKRIGGHATPWSAGNAMFVLSDTHDVAAIFKKDGSIRWSQSLAIADKRDATRDITPALYGPILAGNAVFVLDEKGTLTAFKPTDGSVIDSYELAPNTVTAPLVTNGAMYIVTKDARLYRYN
jgi:outer membrane protein assembly factor BamB